MHQHCKLLVAVFFRAANVGLEKIHRENLVHRTIGSRDFETFWDGFIYHMGSVTVVQTSKLTQESFQFWLAACMLLKTVQIKIKMEIIRK